MMKNRIVFLTALLNCTLSHAASTIECSVSVLSSVCGSGEIKLTFEPGGKFNFQYGDVECWYADSEIVGATSKLPVASPSSFNADSYLLTSLKQQSETEMGTVTFDYKKKVALLKIVRDEFPGSRNSEYHMSCKDVPKTADNFSKTVFEFCCEGICTPGNPKLELDENAKTHCGIRSYRRVSDYIYKTRTTTGGSWTCAGSESHSVISAEYTCQ